MSKKKDTVININPYHAEINVNHDNSFTITFFDKIKDDYTRRKLVKVHFQGWWLKFLGRMLWSVVAKRQKDLERDIHSLKNNAG